MFSYPLTITDSNDENNQAVRTNILEILETIHAIESISNSELAETMLRLSYLEDLFMQENNSGLEEEKKTQLLYKHGLIDSIFKIIYKINNLSDEELIVLQKNLLDSIKNHTGMIKVIETLFILDNILDQPNMNHSHLNRTIHSLVNAIKNTAKDTPKEENRKTRCLMGYININWLERASLVGREKLKLQQATGLQLKKSLNDKVSQSKGMLYYLEEKFNQTPKCEEQLDEISNLKKQYISYLEDNVEKNEKTYQAVVRKSNLINYHQSKCKSKHQFHSIFSGRSSTRVKADKIFNIDNKEGIKQHIKESIEITINPR